MRLLQCSLFLSAFVGLTHAGFVPEVKISIPGLREAFKTVGTLEGA